MLRVLVPLVTCRYARRELNMLFECEEALRIVGRLIKQPEVISLEEKSQWGQIRNPRSRV